MKNVERLKLIIGSPRLRQGSLDFATSLLEQAKKRELSIAQVIYVERFWDECFPSPEVLMEESQWNIQFTEEMKDNTRIMGEYYRLHYSTSHFGKNALDEAWIPPRATYDKLVNSQWAKRICKNYKEPNIFNIGEMCILRDTAKNRSFHKEDVKTPLLILEIRRECSRDYNVFYVVIDPVKMESQSSFEVREDSLNFIKIPKKKKQSV